MKSTIVITGANRGIGLGLAHAYLKEAHHVVATARQPSEANQLKKLQADFPKTCQIETLDIRQDESVRAFAKACSKLGSIDILINNAGVLVNRGDEFSAVDLSAVSECFEVNTVGTMRLTQALLPALQKANRPLVVNISSKMGSIDDNDSGGNYAYRISKAALNMFNKCVAVEFPTIASIVMHPGWVQTDMGGSAAPTTVEQSVKGMTTVIAKITIAQSGKFLDFTGKEIPW